MQKIEKKVRHVLTYPTTDAKIFFNVPKNMFIYRENIYIEPEFDYKGTVFRFNVLAHRWYYRDLSNFLINMLNMPIVSTADNVMPWLIFFPEKEKSAPEYTAKITNPTVIIDDFYSKRMGVLVRNADIDEDPVTIIPKKITDDENGVELLKINRKHFQSSVPDQKTIVPDQKTIERHRSRIITLTENDCVSGATIALFAE